MAKMCAYCADQPVAKEWQHSCVLCVFVCATCNQTTPYELGGSGDENCNDCWAANKTRCPECDCETLDMRGDMCKDCDKERQTGEME